LPIFLPFFFVILQLAKRGCRIAIGSGEADPALMLRIPQDDKNHKNQPFVIFLQKNAPYPLP